MLVVCAYPDCLRARDEAVKGIPQLTEFTNWFLEPSIALHMLPFYPSAGDFGFAPNSLRDLRPDLGTWHDIRQLAKIRPLIVDGIYNHVGVEHEWVRQFFSSPEIASRLIHAYKIPCAEAGPMSPRGQRVLRPYLVNDELWHLWHTFTEFAVDIRLDRDDVIQEVENHLSHLGLHGVWGVRLDAVAYYAKVFGNKVRHNPGAHDIAEKIALLAKNMALSVIAQLDCDEDGARYFSNGEFRDIPINDFTYAIAIADALICGETSAIIRHLNRLSSCGRVLIRSPRTHDGLLLRSGLLEEGVRERVIKYAICNNIDVRFSGCTPYELNCSGTFLYNSVVGNHRSHQAIELITAVTAMASPLSCFYLPWLTGFVPEAEAVNSTDRDPRAINRASMPNSHWRWYQTSHQGQRMRSLLGILTNIHQQRVGAFSLTARGADTHGLLVIEDAGNGFRLQANFNCQSSAPMVEPVGKVLWDSCRRENQLEPLGYAVERL